MDLTICHALVEGLTLLGCEDHQIANISTKAYTQSNNDQSSSKKPVSNNTCNS
jgi:hypothetical protein